MGYISIPHQSVKLLQEDLKRLEKLIHSPYVRQADIARRDQLARRLREAKAVHSH